MPGFDQLLPFAAPPLVGAFIGYLTNAIAIRMMFRPLRPWRICGLRLPLTPGIIPSRRRELAVRLGRVVGDHLVTSQDALRVLERENIHEEIRQTLKKKTGEILDREMGPLSSLVPTEHQGRFLDLIRRAGRYAVQAISEYLASHSFEKNLRIHLRRWMDGFLAKDLECTLTPERRLKLRAAAAHRLNELLTSPRLQAAAGRFIDTKIDDLISSETPLRGFLPEDMAELAFQHLEREIPPLLDKGGSLLFDPDFRTRLEKTCRDGIKSLMASQKGLARILALFINVEKAYDRIPEFIDKTGEEIARLLREEESRLAAAAILRERLDLFLRKPLSHYLGKMPYERIAAARKFLRNQILQLLNNERTAAQILALTDKGIERIQDHSFSSLLRKILGEQGVDQIQDGLAEELLVQLRSPETHRLLERILIDNLEEAIYRKSLGRLSSRMAADIREEMEEAIFRQLLELLRKETPRLFTTLNVTRMVEEKIDSLDLPAMENLLLDIMRDQLKYINLFGALLGFLIGLANVLLLQ